MPRHSVRLAATSLALLVSTAAFAQSSPPVGGTAAPAAAATPPAAAPDHTAPQSASPTPPAQSQPSANTGAATNTNANASQGAQSATTPLTAGLTVKDNTGATIGQVSEVSKDAKSGVQYATIKMGSDSFRLPADRLGVADGAATVNLTQAQIQAQLHPPKH